MGEEDTIQIQTSAHGFPQCKEGHMRPKTVKYCHTAALTYSHGCVLKAGN